MNEIKKSNNKYKLIKRGGMIDTPLNFSIIHYMKHGGNIDKNITLHDYLKNECKK